MIRGILEGFCEELLSAGDLEEEEAEVYAAFSRSWDPIFSELLARLIFCSLLAKWFWWMELCCRSAEQLKSLQRMRARISKQAG